LHVCRFCQIDDTTSPGNPLVLHYGSEYAHLRCIEEANRLGNALPLPAPTPSAAEQEPPWVVAARTIASTPFLRQENDGRVTWVETIRLACIAHAEQHAAALAQERDRVRSECDEWKRTVQGLQSELLETRACYTQAFADRERLTAERDRLLSCVRAVLAECKEPRCQDIHAEPWIPDELGDKLRAALSAKEAP